jgi:O-antigen/teichoic acid export membrane protein
VLKQALEEANCASGGGSPLVRGGVRKNDEDTQGCKSMTHMVTGARALKRGLLQGGAAGDAGAAKGRRIASNIVVQFAARAITVSLSIITVSLMARTLGPTGYGVWNGVSSYVALFAVLSDMGFTIVVVQRMAAEPEREAEWLGALLTGRVAMSLAATALCAATIPLLLTDAHHSQAVGFMLTATILSTGTAGALMAVFQSRLRSGFFLAFSVLQGLLWLSAVAVLAATHASVVAFAAANVVVIALVSGLQVQATRRFARIAWRAGLRLWRPLVRLAIPLGVGSVMITIYYQVDSVLLLGIAGARESGIYGAAYGFLGPLTFLPAAVMSSFFPVLSAVFRRDPDRTRRLVQVCADTMAVISLPILAGTVALSGPIVHLIYGVEFQRAAGLLPILMIAFVSICYGSLAGFLAPLLDLQWRFAIYASVGAAANVALNLALIPPYGAYGSAWATVVTEVLTMSLMFSTSLRALRLRLRVDKMLRTALIALAMTAAMALSAPLGLVPAGLIGVLVYGAGLFALRIVDPGELRMLGTRGEDGPDVVD